MTFPRSSRRFVPSLLALPLLVAAPPLLCVARAQDAAVTAPKAAVVSQISAQSATLSVGQKDGAQAGAVYSLSQGGAEVLRVQITEVRADDSVCRVVSLAPGATVLGETAQFVDIEALPVAPPASATPPVPDAPTMPAAPVAPVPAPSGPLDATPAAPTDTRAPEITPPSPPMSGGASVPITAIDGAVISVGAGSKQGLQSGETLPVMRGANIVALVKLSIVAADSATGNLVYSDPTVALSTSDRLTALGAAPAAPTGSGAPSPTQTGGRAGVVVPFETGASNTSVPKADRTYELLASLAAQGLIKSQPAATFQDDGARRHRYAEDIILSRAQIAGYIREALDNADEDEKGRSSASLAILTRDFRPDLLKLGVESSRLDEEAGGKLTLGVSGFTRARVGGGAKNANANLPFEERYGAGRTKSGLDSRLICSAPLGATSTFTARSIRAPRPCKAVAIPPFFARLIYRMTRESWCAA